MGAVIATPQGDIISVGTNEVPKGGGGLYWEDDPIDHRDFREGYEPTRKERKRIVAEVLERFRDAKPSWLAAKKAGSEIGVLACEAIKEGGVLSGSELLNQIAFDRTVHAEMAALTDSARRRVSTNECILYATTFPCHNCAKHIVASGIRRVVYIEPYPKSLAKRLHKDSITIDAPYGSDQFTNFETFVGLAPRRYLDLFANSDRLDPKTGEVIAWEAANAGLRYIKDALAYTLEERDRVATFTAKLKDVGLRLA